MREKRPSGTCTEHRESHLGIKLWGTLRLSSQNWPEVLLQTLNNDSTDWHSAWTASHSPPENARVGRALGAHSQESWAWLWFRTVGTAGRGLDAESRAGRKWQPTPAPLPGESQGQRSLLGHSLWSRRVRHNWTTNTFIFKSTYWVPSLWTDSQGSLGTWGKLLTWRQKLHEKKGNSKETITEENIS